MASVDKPVVAQDNLPAAVRETLEQAGFSTEGLLAALDSELKLDGQFGAAWLIVTPDQLVVLEGATVKDLTVTRHQALGEIEQLDRLDYFGNTILEARQDGHKEQLLRLPPRKALGFSRELVSINRHIKELRGEDTDQFRLPPVHKPPDICEKCGQPIIQWIGSCLNCINHAQLLKRLLGLGKPYWLVIAAGLLIMALLEGIQLAQPLIQGQMVDQAITVLPDATDATRLEHVDLLKWYILLLLGFRLVALAFGGLRGYLMDWLGEHITYDLRKRLYEHTQRLSLSFYDRKQTGWVMDRITNDAPNLQDFVTWQLPDLLSNSIKLVLVPVILLTKNWMLAVLSLLPGANSNPGRLALHEAHQARFCALVGPAERRLFAAGRCHPRCKSREGLRAGAPRGGAVREPQQAPDAGGYLCISALQYVLPRHRQQHGSR